MFPTSYCWSIGTLLRTWSKLWTYEDWSIVNRYSQWWRKSIVRETKVNCSESAVSMPTHEEWRDVWPPPLCDRNWRNLWSHIDQKLIDQYPMSHRKRMCRKSADRWYCSIVRIVNEKFRDDRKRSIAVSDSMNYFPVRYRSIISTSMEWPNVSKRFRLRSRKRWTVGNESIDWQEIELFPAAKATNVENDEMCNLSLEKNTTDRGSVTRQDSTLHHRLSGSMWNRIGRELSLGMRMMRRESSSMAIETGEERREDVDDERSRTFFLFRQWEESRIIRRKTLISVINSLLFL